MTLQPPWSAQDTENSRTKRLTSLCRRLPTKTTPATCRRFCAKPRSTMPILILLNSLSGSESEGRWFSPSGDTFRTSTAASSRTPVNCGRSTNRYPSSTPTCRYRLSRRTPIHHCLRTPARSEQCKPYPQLSPAWYHCSSPRTRSFVCY
ncbi:putative F-215 22.8 kDa protein [Human mastadenovirus F]|uniref:Putative F-215 22.8 kDa protein n=1 Tax=Human mastadenovirus F TaxID=130309 RepID=A0A7S6TZ34_9ADEN|nr:putative F-215 22.8 kDa protein [Human mastadenovirus F]